MIKKEFKQDHDVKYWWVFPYRWNFRVMFKNVWNPKEPRVLPPKQLGIGWDINLYVVMKKLKGK